MHHLLAQKVAVVFSKTGPAIYHSHHDLIRFWERAVKRANLPMRMTQGFNPHPRIIFPHALGLGIASRHEEVELELHLALNPESILDAIKNAAGDTLGIERVVNLPPIKKSRQIVSSSYQIQGWKNTSTEQLETALRKIDDMTEIIVLRGAPNQKRSMDIKPFLKALSVILVDENPTLKLTLEHKPSGSARPDEIATSIANILGVDPFSLTIMKTEMTLL